MLKSFMLIELLNYHRQENLIFLMILIVQAVWIWRKFPKKFFLLWFLFWVAIYVLAIIHGLTGLCGMGYKDIKDVSDSCIQSSDLANLFSSIDIFVGLIFPMALKSRLKILFWIYLIISLFSGALFH
jgi:hypothetical protein